MVLTFQTTVVHLNESYTFIKATDPSSDIETCISRRKTTVQPWKLTRPLKRDYFNRKYIFQPSIFRGHVSFRGSSLSYEPILSGWWLNPHSCCSFLKFGLSWLLILLITNNQVQPSCPHNILVLLRGKVLLTEEILHLLVSRFLIPPFAGFFNIRCGMSSIKQYGEVRNSLEAVLQLPCEFGGFWGSEQLPI